VRNPPILTTVTARPAPRWSRATLMLLCLLTLGGALGGCAPLVVGGVAATSATVASDRRSVGEQVDDKVIQTKVSQRLSALLAERGRHNVVSYAGRVLLLGDVPDAAIKQQAEQQTREVDRVLEVVNQLRIGPITPPGVRRNDAWLTSKVTGNFIGTKQVPTRTISVTTERGVVYLMGKVTRTESQLAAQVASGVNGVNQVVTLFHIIDDAGTSSSNVPGAAQADRATIPTDGGATGSSLDETPAVQTMPVR